MLESMVNKPLPQPNLDEVVERLTADKMPSEFVRQVERLKKVFAELGEKPTGQHCNGMEGVIEEGKDAPWEGRRGLLFRS